MGRARSLTAAIVGVDAVPVDVEVDVGAGLPSFAIVGLPDVAVQEAKERVRSALKACGFNVPNARVVVNLAPGPLRKHGTGFDLPIALGLLAATGQVPASLAESSRSVGELSLTGRVRTVPGLLAHALSAHRAGQALLGPQSDAPYQVEGLTYRALRTLADLRRPLESSEARSADVSLSPDLDFCDVVGQPQAIRALVIAAAGGHNLLMVGPPGAGKTMLARRLPGILPPLTHDERIQTAVVHSVAGHDESTVLAGRRPFRMPHHSASIAGLVGGGSPPRPGEASLAHNGVLFLDEMPEFGPAALQSLRQPLEDGFVTCVRAEGRLTFPARFSLVAAANPCPCGHLGDVGVTCTCSPTAVSRYRNRIGGPLFDRIDLAVHVARPDPARLLEQPDARSSEALAHDVIRVRERASARGTGPTAALTGSALLSACALDRESTRFLEGAARRQHLSGRGITRVLRVARTVADLEGSSSVSLEHVAEALQYRTGVMTDG